MVKIIAKCIWSAVRHKSDAEMKNKAHSRVLILLSGWLLSSTGEQLDYYEKEREDHVGGLDFKFSSTFHLGTLFIDDKDQ